MLFEKGLTSIDLCTVPATGELFPLAVSILKDPNNNIIDNENL